jgi:ATP synthase protein I
VTKRDEGKSRDQHQDEERRIERRRDDQRLDDEGLQARLDRLSSALDAQRQPDGKASEQDGGSLSAGSLGSAMSIGFRVMSEFVAAVIVGAFIGWQLDKWLGTSPVFLLIFLLFGTAAGFWNVYRIAVKPPGSKGGLI